MENKISDFPKYLKSSKGTVFIRESREVRGGEVTYLKVCGNWRTRVKLKDGVFTYIDIHDRIIDMTPTTVTEFLRDNPKEVMLSDGLADYEKCPERRVYLRKIILDAIEEEKGCK